MLALRTLPLLALLLLAGCSEADATALRLRLAGDLSGQLDLSALSLTEEPAALETEAEGVAWRDRARVSFSTGSFTDVKALRLADISFEAELRAEGLSFVRVHLPRGADARWFRLLTTPDETRRRQLARAMDSSGKADRVGTMVQIVIETPAPVVSSSADPNVRGLKSETQREAATLVVPVESLASGEGEIVWTVIW
jgi:hypothetical protein